MVPFLPVILRRDDEGRLAKLADVLKTGIFDGVQISSPGGLQWLEEIGWQGKWLWEHRV